MNRDYKLQPEDPATCPACGGVGEVLLADDLLYECPACDGHGHVMDWVKPKGRDIPLSGMMPGLPTMNPDEPV